MNSAAPFLTLERSAAEAIPWTISTLETAGLQALCTFDSQKTHTAFPDSPCPHHGAETCDCRMSVLLIYQGQHTPASLLLHSFQCTTWLYLVDTLAQPLNARLGALIRQTLLKTLLRLPK